MIIMRDTTWKNVQYCSALTVISFMAITRLVSEMQLSSLCDGFKREFMLDKSVLSEAWTKQFPYF